MAEIKSDVIYIHRKDDLGREIEGYLIREHTTIADIARWVISQGLDEDLMYFLGNRHEL